jgi:hypothetical protein
MISVAYVRWGHLEDVVMRNSLRATKMLSHYGYALLVLAPITLAIPAHAQSSGRDNYNIMAPEQPVAATPPTMAVPPSLYVPQTGMLLPNLPAAVGSGPGGSETSQDRAMGCANQAGVYGPAQTGDRTAYLGSCINQ